MPRLMQLAPWLIPVFLIAGCGTSEQQSADNQGDSAAQARGAKTLTEQRYLPVGNLHCPLGGLEIVSGVDQDKSGNLQQEEITSIRFQCTPSVPLGGTRNRSDQGSSNELQN